NACDLLVKRRFDLLHFAPGTHRRRDAERSGPDAFVDEAADARHDLELFVQFLIKPRAVAPEEYRAQYFERVLIGRVARQRLIDDERVRQASERVHDRLAALGGLRGLLEIDARRI